MIRFNETGSQAGQELRALVVPVLVLAILGGCARAKIEAAFVPDSDPWTRWSINDPNSARTIDHSTWSGLLARYLQADATGLNRFAYRDVTDADREILAGYIAEMSAVPISNHNRAEQLAYWVNLYNAVTVDTILSHYPVPSIRTINDGLLSSGPWDRALVTVEGQPVTLNDIESRILRPLWDDSRVHYALNCASVGCPNLRMEAFTGATAEAMLEAGAHDYINNPRGVRFQDDELIVSSIYVWFQDDFGGSEDAVLDHLKRYARPELAARLQNVCGFDGYVYDWSLNEGRGA